MTSPIVRLRHLLETRGIYKQAVALMREHVLSDIPMFTARTARSELDAAYDAGADTARRALAIANAPTAARTAGYDEMSPAFKQFCAGYLDEMDRHAS